MVFYRGIDRGVDAAWFREDENEDASGWVLDGDDDGEWRWDGAECAGD
jgi:hypothetical protein